ncbi:MAG: peptidylprolyl isomerase [Candidatus Cloacimonetes bacterium]|nr:peptidylprolyl isomerase [Candidatus Cloacimonadota bacterium]
MKRILLLIAISIILLSCSGPRGDSAGIINGERILYPDFVRSYQGHTANFQARTGRAPSADEKSALFNATWEDITKHIILKEQFKRYDITVTPQEVIDSLMVTIPVYLKDNAALMTDGKFDQDLYYQSVRYDSPVNMSPVRRNYYEYYVPIQKLKQKLIDVDLNKSKAARRISEIVVSKADFDLLIFDPARMNPVVSDTEIQAFYQKNLKRFALEPIYGVSYISLPVNPAEADREYTVAITDSIYEELGQGKTFETVISERQEQLPDLRVVNPGFVRVENVDSDLLSALDYLPDDGYSKPTAVGRGFAIYQKLQRTKSMINYRALQIPPILVPATINAQFNQAEGILNLAREIGIQAAANELDLPVVSRSNISVSDLWHKDMAIIEQVNSQLMTQKKGDFLKPLYSTLTGSWIVLQLTENQVNRVRPLSDVKYIILPELIDSRRLLLAEQKAHEWLSQNPSLKTNKDSEQYLLKQYDKGGIHSEYAGQSLDLAYLKALQRYLNKEKPRPISLGDYHIIIIPRNYYPDKRSKADPQVLKELYIRQLDPDWFDFWIQERLAKANVQIYVKP